MVLLGVSSRSKSARCSQRNKSKHSKNVTNKHTFTPLSRVGKCMETHRGRRSAGKWRDSAVYCGSCWRRAQQRARRPLQEPRPLAHPHMRSPNHPFLFFLLSLFISSYLLFYSSNAQNRNFSRVPDRYNKAELDICCCWAIFGWS